MAKYDVVVVGAGNSGLAAALHMQQAGKKTLLIEQHNLPGGCASSFVRGRFEIEPSLHELCDVGSVTNPGDVRQLMDLYGVDVDWIEVPDCFRVVSKWTDGEKMDVTMPAGRQPFIDAVEKYVPGSKQKMEELFELFDEVLAGIGYISASNGHADSDVLKKEYPNLLRTGAYPTLKVLKAMKLPQRAIDIMSVYWAYLGVDLEHLSFIHYAAMVHKYVTRGAYIPKHTSHEISVKMAERFREQFRRINNNFTETFKELFDGGRAELVLDDPQDVLECNINIRVQPPGKNVQNIDLLSGGEKGLAAIALLFAILKVTPAPFCIFDEVEAALDDINVSRYAQYVRNMTDRTQFILITHRRGTMDEADMLYGVTMQEKGVSKLLELKTAEMAKKLGLE